MTFFIQDDVLWFEIAVDIAETLNMVEGRTYLYKDTSHLAHVRTIVCTTRRGYCIQVTEMIVINSGRGQ